MDAVALAHEHYKQSTPRRLCVLMIVQGMNFNICDERPIEYGLVDRGIPCYRCDWYDVLSRTALDRDSVLQFTHPCSGEQYEVTVVVSAMESSPPYLLVSSSTSHLELTLDFICYLSVARMKWAIILG